MYSKDTLAGIILSNATLQINASRDITYKLGYSLKIKLILRGSPEYLEAVYRSLMQHQIHSKIRVVESKNRPKPILSIGRISDLVKIENLLPKNAPTNKFNKDLFEKLLEIITTKKHLTLNGLDEILKLKEVL